MFFFPRRTEKLNYPDVKILETFAVPSCRLTKIINLDVCKLALRLLAAYVAPDPAQEGPINRAGKRGRKPKQKDGPTATATRRIREISCKYVGAQSSLCAAIFFRLVIFVVVFVKRVLQGMPMQ